MNRKADTGREGRPLNFSPARKGWETDRQDCGALEARHYQHSGCRASGARTMLRNRCPSPPGLGLSLATGPPGLGPIRGLFSSSHTDSEVRFSKLVPARNYCEKPYLAAKAAPAQHFTARLKPCPSCKALFRSLFSRAGRETAGPSTTLRSGRDDNSVAGKWSQKRSDEWLLMVPQNCHPDRSVA
jgi:hypothetical protein